MSIWKITKNYQKVNFSVKLSIFRYFVYLSVENNFFFEKPKLFCQKSLSCVLFEIVVMLKNILIKSIKQVITLQNSKII